MFAPSHRKTILFHLIAYPCTLYLLYTGTMFEWGVVLFLYFFKTTICGTITYHRLLAHKSFVAPKWFEYFGTLLATTGCGGSSISWVATHREHHRHSDTDKDPHSPSIMGYFYVQFLLIYNVVPKIKYVPDLLRSTFHVFVHRYYWLFSLAFALVVTLIDTRALLYAYIVPSLLLWHGQTLVNSLNHSKFGYRNYSTTDFSINNFITGYVASGEGWHNNHHNDPSNPRFGQKWYEFDLGWHIIQLVRLDK